MERNKFIKYVYYDSDHHRIAVLNKEYLCMLLGVDKILLEEPPKNGIDVNNMDNELKEKI